MSIKVGVIRKSSIRSSLSCSKNWFFNRLRPVNDVSVVDEVASREWWKASVCFWRFSLSSLVVYLFNQIWYCCSSPLPICRTIWSTEYFVAFAVALGCSSSWSYRGPSSRITVCDGVVVSSGFDTRKNSLWTQQFKCIPFPLQLCFCVRQ